MLQTTIIQIDLCGNVPYDPKWLYMALFLHIFLFSFNSSINVFALALCFSFIHSFFRSFIYLLVCYFVTHLPLYFLYFLPFSHSVSLHIYLCVSTTKWNENNNKTAGTRTVHKRSLRERQHAFMRLSVLI